MANKKGKSRKLILGSNTEYNDDYYPISNVLGDNTPDISSNNSNNEPLIKKHTKLPSDTLRRKEVPSKVPRRTNNSEKPVLERANKVKRLKKLINGNPNDSTNNRV